MIALIKSYYPTLPLDTQEMMMVVWRDEFATYDKNIVFEATRQICREEKNGLKVNVASIKKRVAELEEENKRKEYFRNQQKEVEENLNYQASDYTKNKFKEMLAKYGR